MADKQEIVKEWLEDELTLHIDHLSDEDNSYRAIERVLQSVELILDELHYERFHAWADE